MLDTLEPVNPQVFQIAWESTLKCNLDCSYCGDGHNNKIPHPSITETLDTVDFIINYVSVIMQSRKVKEASLNIQGGESLVHPQIIQILKYTNAKAQDLDWKLYINTITNAVVKDKIWARLVQYINFFTISFHSESSYKQQEQVRKNILYLKTHNKNFHVSIMMHPKYWDTCVDMVEWCKANDVKFNIRQIDHHWMDFRFNYTSEQAAYISRGAIAPTIVQKAKAVVTGKVNLSAQSRECCGGLEMCTNETACTKRVENKFKGWHCSVDKHFLYIRQTTGEVFINKDCRMNFDGKVGPIGNLKNTQAILDRISAGTNTIICKKSYCNCGLCAPKAQHKDDYDRIMVKYV
jgi:sulfatase maturation enzyme AslB (radical SAM superfamily)